MGIIFNDIYVLMSGILRSSVATDLTGKALAFNEGYKQLVERMVKTKRGPAALLATKSDFSTLINTNYVALPSDYLRYQSIWKKSGTSYLKVEYDEIILLEQLQSNVNFFDTDNTGLFNQMAIEDSLLYFDCHFPATSTDAIKVMYWRYPTAVPATPTLQSDETIELDQKYKLALAEAGAAIYLHMAGEIEAQEKDQTLDNLIMQIGTINVAGSFKIRPAS